MAGAAVTASPPAGAASTTTSALSWVRLPGAESCISAPELGARVEAHLGRAAFVSPGSAELSIEGRVEPIQDGRRFRVTVTGARRDGSSLGSRELSSNGQSCRSLDEALVLIVALMVDPDAAEPARPAPAEPAPVAAPPPEADERSADEARGREAVVGGRRGRAGAPVDPRGGVV